MKKTLKYVTIFAIGLFCLPLLTVYADSNCDGVTSCVGHFTATSLYSTYVQILGLSPITLRDGLNTMGNLCFATDDNSFMKVRVTSDKGGSGNEFYLKADGSSKFSMDIFPDLSSSNPSVYAIPYNTWVELNDPAIVTAKNCNGYENGGNGLKGNHSGRWFKCGYHYEY